jgi:hypothetical protein
MNVDYKETAATHGCTPLIKEETYDRPQKGMGEDLRIRCLC